ncbi:MAG: AraC family transcriptional regulator [Bacilli bacterium]|jgi:AraC-like DNA-binding protein|nr:AraC family transcriptional regulator [Bacilli bacterium]
METIKKQEGFIAQKLFVLPQTMLEELPQHPLMRSLYMTDMGHFPFAHFHYRERPEGCSSHILIYCSGGSGWFSIDGQRRIAVHQGVLIVIPANTSHIYASDDKNPWSIYWLHMKGSDVFTYLGDSAKVQPLPISAEKSIGIVKLFQECFHILEKGYSLNNLIYVSQILGHLLSLIFVYQGQQPISVDPNSFTIDRAIQVMIDRLDSTLTLNDLTEQVNLSKPHLIHLFKKHTGYSPIDYYLRLKIQRACQLLDFSEFTLKEICGKLGIADPYYFSRLFSKIMGISPTQYRKLKKG